MNTINVTNKQFDLIIKEIYKELIYWNKIIKFNVIDKYNFFIDMTNYKNLSDDEILFLEHYKLKWMIIWFLNKIWFRINFITINTINKKSS